MNVVTQACPLLCHFRLVSTLVVEKNSVNHYQLQNLNTDNICQLCAVWCVAACCWAWWY